MATGSTTQKKTTKHSTQQYLDVAEIRDGVVILRDGSFRAILMASSLNFALKSEEEQDAIIYGYQDFINSVSFPIQILMTSRKIDIEPYIRQLSTLEEAQESELMKIQLQEYREYIRELVKVSNVMTKSFYIVIPFAAAQSEDEGGFTKFIKSLRVRGGIAPHTPSEFERYRDQLWQRVNQVAANLRNLGVRVVPLNTQEIIELFYQQYNPDTARNQRLPYVTDLDIEDARAEAVAQKRIQDEEDKKMQTVAAPDIEEAERRYQERQGRDI